MHKVAAIIAINNDLSINVIGASKILRSNVIRVKMQNTETKTFRD
ncbi:MAG: hypothetical protein ACTSW3_10005 [Promethearchaeota archaeon]